MTPSEYRAFYTTARVTDDAALAVQLDGITEGAALAEPRYATVGRLAQVPWVVVAAIHFRESSQQFSRHLHNGDPLTGRTLHVPRGRPAMGSPPFTWEESAIDAFTGLWRPGAWDVAGMLEFMERYNGLGYQRHGINSPYLWDGTNYYLSGLFTYDGRFDPDAKENRPGCVAILKTFEAKGASLAECAAIPTGHSPLHS